MAQSPAAQRIHTNRRQDFDSYFPVEEYDNQTGKVYDTDYASLPFPAPLTSLRSSFRGDDFECDTFLLEHQKHGQLDDLLLELRDLSALLDSELIKGVESDYEAFIGLGRIDSRKVGELKKGVVNLTEQLSKIEAEVQGNLDDIEATLRARRDLRSRKRRARRVLKVSMSIDELAFMLEEGDDVEGALEAFEQLCGTTHRTPLPEYDRSRYDDLSLALLERLQALVKSSKTDDQKLEHAVLLRRYYSCRPISSLAATETTA